MDDRWQQIERIYHAAREMPANARSALGCDCSTGRNQRCANTAGKRSCCNWRAARWSNVTCAGRNRNCARLSGIRSRSAQWALMIPLDECPEPSRRWPSSCAKASPRTSEHLEPDFDERSFTRPQKMFANPPAVGPWTPEGTSDCPSASGSRRYPAAMKAGTIRTKKSATESSGWGRPARCFRGWTVHAIRTPALAKKYAAWRSASRRSIFRTCA